MSSYVRTVVLHLLDVPTAFVCEQNIPDVKKATHQAEAAALVPKKVNPGDIIFAHAGRGGEREAQFPVFGGASKG